LGSTSAFCPSAFVSHQKTLVTSSSSSARHVSVAVEETDSMALNEPIIYKIDNVPELIVEESTINNSQMTRFDRMKRTMKHYTNQVETRDLKGLDFDYTDFQQAFEETKYEFEREDIVSGQCEEYVNGGCLVDIGAKSSAFLPQQEAALIQPPGASIESLVELETPYEFEIVSDENEDGQLIVSIRRIEYRNAWTTVQSMQEEDESFEAEIISINRGGAICLVNGLRAFLPGSHLSGMMATEDLIGTVLPLKFLEVNPEEGKLVVSNRKAVVEKQMTNLSRGDIVSGMVKAIKPYGAFVEVGGVSGLLHISQISYDRIEDLEQVLQPGMNVKCMIIDHDKVNGRIALSTKTLEAEPGDMLKDPERVFTMAEETAKKYHERMEAERKAREEAARDIVLGLGSLDDLGGGGGGGDSSGGESSDPLADVSDSLESLLG